MDQTNQIHVRVRGGNRLRERVTALASPTARFDSSLQITITVVETTDEADCVVTDDSEHASSDVPTVVIADDLAHVPGFAAGFVRSDAPIEHLADQLYLAARPDQRAARSKAELLHGVSTQMVACDDPSSVYELAVEAADRILDFDFSYVAEAGEEHFLPQAFSSNMAPDGYDDAMRIDEGIAGETYQRGESILLADLTEVSDAKPADDSYRAALSVPIGEFGIFQAASRSPDAFDEHDRELVELLMSHVGETVERLRTEAELRDRNRAIERLHTVGTGLVTCQSETELYQRMVSAAEEVLDFEVCVVVTKEPDSDTLEIRAASNSPIAPPEGGLLPTDTGLIGETYLMDKPMLVEDVADEIRAEPYEEAYRSALSVPFGGFGVVQAIDDEPGAFDERDLHLAELLVSQSAGVAARIRAEADLRSERDRLREFASVVSHDLRSPLNVVEGYVDLAVETGDVSHLDHAANALERIDGLIDDVLELARQQTVEETVPVNLSTLVDAAAHSVGLDRVTMATEALIVDADRDRLMRLFENLFRNAVEHGSQSAASPAPGRDSDQSSSAEEITSDVTVRVGPLGDDDGPFTDGFYVADDGPGVPIGEREAVFDSGYTTAGKGTGLGLAIVQSIAQAHGWTVSVGESESGGARFEFTLK